MFEPDATQELSTPKPAGSLYSLIFWSRLSNLVMKSESGTSYLVAETPGIHLQSIVHYTPVDARLQHKLNLDNGP